eukprot:TRINITY_DN30500_c0_g1_i1.p1 TRINITY_DN30500_c0_g1~~TRINITY_DN30500_c0_g1_i1.p1  ORF type:complete len:424 (+),score=122.11 TRINITY_DN30500_c0_g1_i1:44-1315(+)
MDAMQAAAPLNEAVAKAAGALNSLGIGGGSALTDEGAVCDVTADQALQLLQRGPEVRRAMLEEWWRVHGPSGAPPLMQVKDFDSVLTGRRVRFAWRGARVVAAPPATSRDALIRSAMAVLQDALPSAALLLARHPEAGPLQCIHTPLDSAEVQQIILAECAADAGQDRAAGRPERASFRRAFLGAALRLRSSLAAKKPEAGGRLPVFAVLPSDKTEAGRPQLIIVTVDGDRTLFEAPFYRELPGLRGAVWVEWPVAGVAEQLSTAEWLRSQERRREEAKRMLAEKRHDEAAAEYELALAGSLRRAGAASDAAVSEARRALLLNLSLCELRRKRWRAAVDACSEVLLIAPDDGKAYYRRATALKELGDTDAALADATRAVTLTEQATGTADAAAAALVAALQRGAERGKRGGAETALARALLTP